jgi:large subunit ribosomal protein L28
MTCDICSKRHMTGKQLSHSHIRTPKRQHANVQKLRAVVDGRKVRLKVCTRCIRSGRVSKSA